MSEGRPAQSPLHFKGIKMMVNVNFLQRSICTEPLKELTNAGASGSIFYVSQDDQFIIKTVQHKEAEFLQKLLPGYYMNLNQNPRTLLPKFFGLFCYQSLGKNIRLLVMNNLLPQTVTMHEKYDLKGSTYKRMANKAERAKAHPTLKDLDFNEAHRDGLLIEPVALDALIKTISRDCLVLESFKIMDYSLLVGIHNVEWAAANGGQRSSTSSTSSATSQKAGDDPTTSAGVEDGDASGARPKPKWSVWESSDPDTPHGGVPARNANGDRLILYLGIIDILQNYRLLKKFEHTWKAILHDGDTISVHNPNFYASRFLSFMTDHVFRKGPALKQSPSRRRAGARKSLGDDEAKEIPPLNSAEVVAQSARDALIRSVAASASPAPTAPVSARDVVPVLIPTSTAQTSTPQAPSSARALPMRRSYRDGSEKRDKKVERLFATPSSTNRPENEPLREQDESPEEITRL
ncbi:unnamed protein product [Caenorhabditis auriculariae]|uniref:PIPK domain-containing protein n=1 Tax=Caenorhabditis auriculariae TaxID=2777116 RepID=A0A8S1HQP2_9PELO|nr:unnamed protein product [Caenorhabditis auriculariae]